MFPNGLSGPLGSSIGTVGSNVDCRHTEARLTFMKPAQDALYEPLPYRVSDHDPVIVAIRLER